MNAMNVLNIVLWSVQGFLALFFLVAAAPKISGRGIEKWTGFSDLPRSQVIFIGFAEAFAAVGLAITVLMATGFHLRADERLNAVETGLWAAIAATVAIGRWDLVGSVAGVSSWVLVALLGLLVPVAILNVIVLWRRPVKRGTLAGTRGDSNWPSPANQG